MSPETEQKLEKVKKYSRSLHILFRVAMALATFGGVMALVLVAAGPLPGSEIEIGGNTYTGDAITGTVRFTAAVGIVISFAIMLKLLHHLSSLFRLYSRGRIFTADNVRQIHEIGVAVLLFTAAWGFDLLAHYILGLGRSPALMTAVDVASNTTVRIPGPFATIVAGTIIMVVSWVMDAGRELREEQDLTV